MSRAQPGASNKRKAELLYQEALEAYQRWDVDHAVETLEQALELAPDMPSYHMVLAQSLSRAGDFDRALRALANFLRLAPESPVASRIEQLFASGMDPVEEMLTKRMTAQPIPKEIICPPMQKWPEFNISLGEEILPIPKPGTWAAALDYTVRKVNLRDVPMDNVAQYYGISAETLRKHHKTLVESLDIMPCDYRYYSNEENPLDKLVEAAELLEQLETRFSQE